MADVKYGQTSGYVFRKAVAFLAKKTALSKEEYQKLSDRARAKAFTVSGYTKAEVLDTFLQELVKAVEQGDTKETFRRNMNSFLARNGYDAMNPWKSDTIFRTNVQSAYNAGHYESMVSDGVRRHRPYWQYRTAGDGDVRPSHAAMEGRVYMADDPIWDIWYPPNGFRCRCSVVTLSKKQMEQRGLSVSKRAPYEVDYTTGEIRDYKPDRGFSNNPAKDTFHPDMTRLSPLVRKVYRENTKQPR